MTLKNGQMTSVNELIPNADGSNLSHEFVVGSKPVIIRAFNLVEGQSVFIEQGVRLNCGVPVWGPYRRADHNADMTQLLPDVTAVIVTLSGLYRVFVYDPDELGIDDVVVVQHEQATNCCH